MHVQQLLQESFMNELISLLTCKAPCQFKFQIWNHKLNLAENIAMHATTAFLVMLVPVLVLSFCLVHTVYTTSPESPHLHRCMLPHHMSALHMLRASII